MKKCYAFLVLAVVLVLCLASGSFGQTVQGVIAGAVSDPSGASVPDATVTITNVGTNASQTTTTGSDGSYRFSLVPPGTYVVEVRPLILRDLERLESWFRPARLCRCPLSCN